MKSFIQYGRTLTLLAAYAVVSGAGCLIGSIFGVAQTDVANGAEGEFDIEGVFNLAKATGEAWTPGQKIYWDNANKRCTTTAGGNTLIGAAANKAGQLAGDMAGWVRLNGTVS